VDRCKFQEHNPRRASKNIIHSSKIYLPDIESFISKKTFIPIINDYWNKGLIPVTGESPGKRSCQYVELSKADARITPLYCFYIFSYILIVESQFI